MKTFIDHDLPRLRRIDGLPQGRMYETPSGDHYPSVTTVVGSIGDKSFLVEWRAKVGEAVADKITQDAANRGTLIHDRCEQYLKGLPVKFTIFQHVEKEMFEWLLPVLEEVDFIHAMETQLYSDKLKVAGTVDLIAMYKGEMAVIDWKNSRRPKLAADIPGYFAQCAAYAFMFWERTGILVKKIIIAMTVEDYGLMVFNVDVKDHLPVFIEARNQFKVA